MHLFYSESPSGHSFSFCTVVCSNDEHPLAWFEGTQGRRKALYLKNTEKHCHRLEKSRDVYPVNVPAVVPPHHKYGNREMN